MHKIVLIISMLFLFGCTKEVTQPKPQHDWKKWVKCEGGYYQKRECRECGQTQKDAINYQIEECVIVTKGE